MNWLSFAPTYLLYRLAYTVFSFVKHWYVGSFFAIDKFMRGLLGRLDRSFALRITLRNLTKPLYQDYSYIGYAMGFLFRAARLVAGGILYGILIALSMCAYALWISIPLFLVYKLI